MELTVGTALRAVFRPKVVGADNVPASGPVILAANHVSFCDEVFSAITSGRQVFFFAKAEYFNAPGLKGAAMAALCRGLGQVPVERKDTRSAAASIDVGVDLLAEGRVLGIFPEGTRSPDGRLHKFRTGVARLALRSEAPVVPVGLIGTREVQPPGTRGWHRAPLEVHFGTPLVFAGMQERERSARVLREITETVRADVQRLSRQDYVDDFAVSAKLAG